MKAVISMLFIITACLSSESHSEETKVSTANQNSEENKGTIAVFMDDIPVVSMVSSPEYLASVLNDAGFETKFLSASDLCDCDLMQKDNFDVLILPYGGSFPAKAQNPLISYLKSGGHFLSMGGYAFDNLLVDSDGEWKPLPEDSEICINTRKGKTHDTLVLHPDQIGVFDPSYPLKRVSYIESAPDQLIFGGKFRIDGNFEGYAASSMAGSNSPVFPERYGRWIPMLYARDAYGRLRGSAGAIVHNYAGPYAGSSWAFFGVTNHDLFAPGNKLAASALIKIVDSLIDRQFVTAVNTKLACYHPGEESVAISVSANSGDSISLEIYDDNYIDPVFMSIEKLVDGVAEATWLPEEFESDFYRVRARLIAGNKTVDIAETGFVVWNNEIVSNGFPIKYGKNYLRYGDKAVFLSGTNQTGMIFASANENPLVWKQDIEKMADHDVNIMRVLHFSPFIVSHTGNPRATPMDLDIDALPEKTERQLDALVQLCQKYGVILFLTLHDWMGVELSDAELAAQKKFAQVIGARYSDVPGIMYDVQNEPSIQLSTHPDIKREFNDYLREKYETTENLAAAWQVSPPSEELGNIEVLAGTEEWSDVKAYDINRFKANLFNRWVRANADGIRSVSPDHLVTVGYIQWMHSADKVLGAEHSDFSNVHFYGNPKDFAKYLKLIDRRFEGKSLSMGEFGAKAHPTWPLGGSFTTMRGGINWFLRVGHYSLGMGASSIANWDWKDMPDCIFPWGINHPCDMVPKDILLAYRNQSMFFQHIEPKYEEPELYYLIPDSHRLGGQSRRLTEVIMNGIDLLLSCHIDFNVINEYSLDKLPKSARAIIYPVPFCPSDKTYNLVKNFVADGGVLYLSGDTSYDENRDRTRQERLEELCGVRYLSEIYPNIAGSHEAGPCINVEPITATILPESDAEIMINSLGRGKIFYCTDPVEFHATDPGIYRKFLDFAGVKRISIKPDDADIRVFRLPTEQDETVYVFFNESDVKKRATLDIDDNSISITLRGNKSGLITIGTSGEVIALESQGKIEVNSRMALDTDCHVMILSNENMEISKSKSLALFPIEPGHIKIATKMDWKKPVIGVGEIQLGEWRCFEKIDAEFSEGVLSFHINELQSLNVLLLAEADSLDKLAEEILGEE